MIPEDANSGKRGLGERREKEEAINIGRRHSRCCNSPEEGSAAFESKLRVQIGRPLVAGREAHEDTLLIKRCPFARIGLIIRSGDAARRYVNRVSQSTGIYAHTRIATPAIIVISVIFINASKVALLSRSREGMRLNSYKLGYGSIPNEWAISTSRRSRLSLVELELFYKRPSIFSPANSFSAADLLECEMRCPRSELAVTS